MGKLSQKAQSGDIRYKEVTLADTPLCDRCGFDCFLVAVVEENGVTTCESPRCFEQAHNSNEIQFLLPIGTVCNLVTYLLELHQTKMQ